MRRVEALGVHRLGVLFVALLAIAGPTATVDVPGARAAGSLPAECSPVSGNVADCTVPVPAAVGSVGAVDTHVRIVTPDPAPAGPMPVVYLLHGIGDTFQTWVDRSDVEDFAAGLGALIVMPDGGRNSESGWYSDWVDGSRRYETFHTDVVVPWVDANFATAAGRDHRAVVGLSMGGFGAVKYAARRPDLFSAAGSISGFLDTQTGGPVAGVVMGQGRPYVGTPDERIWGDPVTDGDEWAAHNPTALARSGTLNHLAGNLWLSTGTGTPGGPAGEPASPASYATEPFIFQSFQQFRVAAVQAGLTFHDHSYLGGAHDWPYYEMSLHRMLPEVVAAIG